MYEALFRYLKSYLITIHKDFYNEKYSKIEAENKNKLSLYFIRIFCIFVVDERQEETHKDATHDNHFI